VVDAAVGSLVTALLVGERVGSSIVKLGSKVEVGPGVVDLEELEGARLVVKAEGGDEGSEELESEFRVGVTVGSGSALDGEEEGAGDGASAICHAWSLPPWLLKYKNLPLLLWPKFDVVATPPRSALQRSFPVKTSIEWTRPFCSTQ
jgi:hypothetical protein